MGDLGAVGPDEGPAGCGGPGGLLVWWPSVGGGGGRGLKWAGDTTGDGAAGTETSRGGRGGRGVFLAEPVLASNVADFLLAGGGGGGGAGGGEGGGGGMTGRTGRKTENQSTLYKNVFLRPKGGGAKNQVGSPYMDVFLSGF